MKAKKNARTDVGASERAKLEAGTGQATTSNDHDTTVGQSGQVVHIADFLSHGADHGVHLSDLVRLTDLPDREVRRQIERERRAGALILSDNKNGYFLAADPAEAKRFARSMLIRAGEIRKTALVVEATAERMMD